MLAEIINRRGIERIAYFHCDHFEPWRWPLLGGVEGNAAEIIRFAEQSAANEFSRRLTLFYKAHVGFARAGKARGAMAPAPGDPFVFLPRPPKLEEACRDAMIGLRRRVNHEIQVHVHHENYTYNTAQTDPKLLEAFDQPDGRERDAARLEFALRLSLDAIRRETDLPLDRWFFVHGQWGLNASDPSVCHITDEIAILMRNGGIGDFTFPAGRPNVDPHIEQPHFVRPVNAPRGYMLPQAAPESAFGNAEAARSKFFIWASEIRHRGTSLDYYSDHVLQDLADPEGFARRVFEHSYVADGTLYFKTHAHSMHPNYARDGGALMFPHQHPAIRRMMGTLFDAASSEGAVIDFVSASDVYDEFIQPRAAPPGGFRLEAPTDPLSLGKAVPVLHETSESLPYVDELNTVASELILQILAGENGVEHAGGSYYESRARQGVVLAPYEMRVARALLWEPAFEAIYEIGSGVSALSICLALNGARGIGIERDLARASLGQAILDRLARSHPELPSRCEIRRQAAPLALRGLDGSNSAIVFTNIAATISAPDLDEIIGQAAMFRTVVVDLSRFFEARDKTAQATLLDRFIRAGCGSPAPISSAFDTYWIFRKSILLDSDME